MSEPTNSITKFCDTGATILANNLVKNLICYPINLNIQYINFFFVSAREFGDRAAERRAHSNLGNAHIFLGEFERAADHYKRTLLLAQDLGDRAVEAQACYSLGNTYTLLKDYPNAIEYHLR